jgi:drug/metabolite transporter (DMT)-like permease
MRVGEVSFVTPFRYSRILFALAIGMVVFDERPDTLTLVGAAVIVGSGLYTLWRERKHRPAPPGGPFPRPRRGL